MPDQDINPQHGDVRAQIELGPQQVGDALREYCAQRGWTYVAHNLFVETGDPGDTREAGYRSETIKLTVKIPALKQAGSRDGHK